MAKRILTPIIRSIKRLREVEKVTKRYAGFEEDHDYDLSDDYYFYLWTLRKLGLEISELPQPDGWIELSKWCDKNPHHFGAPTMANVHYCNLDWEKDVQSLRTQIIESIHRRLKERGIRPEDKKIWSDSRVIDLLKDTDWIDYKTHAPGSLIFEDPRVEFKLVEIAHLLGKEGKVFRDTLSEELRKAVYILDEIGTWFKPKKLTIGTEKDTVFYKFNFSLRSIPKGSRIELHVNRRDRDLRNEIEQLEAKITRGNKSGKMNAQGITKGTTAELGKTWIKVKCDTKKAKKEWDIPKGTPLELVVRSPIPPKMRKGLVKRYFESYRPNVEYICAIGIAPEPPFPVGDGRYKCQTCGDETRVRIDGNCPACNEGIPSERPLKGNVLKKMKKINERWRHMECRPYGCYGREFKRRYRRTLNNDLVCLRCKHGWMIEDGEIVGPDPRNRTSSIKPPGLGWKWGWGKLEDDINRDKLPEDECIKFICKEIKGYRSISWGGEPWIRYITLIADEFEKYLDELEARKKSSKEGKEKKKEQAWLDKNGQRSRDTIVLLRKQIKKFTKK